ncbi:class I SAM-dependent methyltransferase, partial [Mycolicibacterium fortuitum]|uniref:class I SAM-dependent methyltransferase n=1 Tax=Mycolicibacterium fortuitum TaxID=1766 RepID=UPI000A7B476D
KKDEAIALQGQEVYDRFMKYLTGCACFSCAADSPGLSLRSRSPMSWAGYADGST